MESQPIDPVSQVGAGGAEQGGAPMATGVPGASTSAAYAAPPPRSAPSPPPPGSSPPVGSPAPIAVLVQPFSAGAVPATLPSGVIYQTVAPQHQQQAGKRPRGRPRKSPGHEHLSSLPSAGQHQPFVLSSAPGAVQTAFISASTSGVTPVIATTTSVSQSTAQEPPRFAPSNAFLASGGVAAPAGQTPPAKRPPGRPRKNAALPPPPPVAVPGAPAPTAPWLWQYAAQQGVTAVQPVPVQLNAPNGVVLSIDPGAQVPPVKKSPGRPRKNPFAAPPAADFGAAQTVQTTPTVPVPASASTAPAITVPAATVPAVTAPVVPPSAVSAPVVSSPALSAWAVSAPATLQQASAPAPGHSAPELQSTPLKAATHLHYKPAPVSGQAHPGVKRPRGRPRKNPLPPGQVPANAGPGGVAAVPQISGAFPTQPAQGIARQPQVVQADVSQAMVSVGPDGQVKRKRGRPPNPNKVPKVPKTGVTSFWTASEPIRPPTMPSPMKKPRGRPRKNPLPENATWVNGYPAATSSAVAPDMSNAYVQYSTNAVSAGSMLPAPSSSISIPKPAAGAFAAPQVLPPAPGAPQPGQKGSRFRLSKVAIRKVLYARSYLNQQMKLGLKTNSQVIEWLIARAGIYCPDEGAGMISITAAEGE